GRGCSSYGVECAVGLSHPVLPRLSLPLALRRRDGAHGFPYPTLDGWFVAPQVKGGGRILLDDAYLPPVAAVLDYARESAAWEIERAIGYRTVVVRKLADELPAFDWDGSRLGRGLSFAYLPPSERVVAATRHRVFSTKAGLALVGLYRRGSGLSWRKTG